MPRCRDEIWAAKTRAWSLIREFTSQRTTVNLLARLSYFKVEKKFCLDRRFDLNLSENISALKELTLRRTPCMLNCWNVLRFAAFDSLFSNLKDKTFISIFTSWRDSFCSASANSISFCKFLISWRVFKQNTKKITGVRLIFGAPRDVTRSCQARLLRAYFQNVKLTRSITPGPCCLFRSDWSKALLCRRAAALVKVLGRRRFP